MWKEFAARHPEQISMRLRALSGAPWDPGIETAMLREIRDAILSSALTSNGKDTRDPFSTSASTLRTAWSC